MGKKKNKKVKAVEISLAPFATVKENLIKKVNILLNKKCAIIGTTAILRLLSKDEFGLIIASKNMCSPLFHEINTLCESVSVPLLSIEHEFIKNIEIKKIRISLIGIKKDSYIQDEELKQYVQKLQKKKKQKEIDELQSEVHVELENLLKKESSVIDNSCKPPLDVNVNYTYCKQKPLSNRKLADSFISLEDNSNSDFVFPNYRSFFKIERLSINVKDENALQSILDD